MRQLAHEEGGFTLVEALVTMMIMTTVLFALYSIFDMSIRVFSFGNDKIEATENARMGLEKMERELRSAYPYDKAGGNATLFPSFASNSITFGNDLNGNRKVEPGTEQITYALSGNSLQRNSASVVELVKANGLTFKYLDKSGIQTADETMISRVRIKLEVEIDRGSLGKRTQTLTTDVSLRNRSS